MQEDEVTVEQYISPEMKEKMEEAEKLEEQKELAEMVTATCILCGLLHDM